MSTASAANGRLIPPSKVGTITFSQRDVPGRLAIATGNPVMGFLGGPGFPEDPTDLGPLVPLPGGWRELFEFFAGVGIKQVEFAGYGQNAANPGGTASYPTDGNAAGRAAYLDYAGRLRGFLDEFGLEAIGNHGFVPSTWNGPNSPGGVMSAADELRLRTELEFAAILGMPYMGTGGDPTNAGNRNIEPWTIAGEKWTALNQLSVGEYGIQMYTHNHSPAYHFLQDGPMVTVTEDRVTGAPIAPTQVRAESGKRLMQHYLDTTDPSLVVVEMDIFWAHVAQHQWRWRYDENGDRVEDIFDPLAQVARQTKRYALYHAKDGDRTTQPPGVGNGYDMVPFGDPRSDIDFARFFRKQGAKGFHNPNYEQDNAPGGTADPGQSLRFTHISAANMNGLRG
ncbi:sugar phosphate isomerase/epimerase family protein [Nocardioides insulae]|uniref:sugar phosphate isomerase/epimerase family protein n=1 Tax=Nocardioides insulae TaxID=394734 RepID=UPI001FE08EE7|nr:sugar phosphate isomerase/epimerase [Nocardioides insulae]